MYSLIVDYKKIIFNAKAIDSIEFMLIGFRLDWLSNSARTDRECAHSNHLRDCDKS